MKIVHVINSLGLGGAERQLALVSREVARLGLDQVVVPIVRAGNNPKLVVPILKTPRSRLFSILASTFGAVRVIRKSHKAVVVAWMYHSWLLSIIAVRLSFRFPNIFLYCRHGDLQSLQASTTYVCRLALWLAAKYDPVIVFNSYQARASHASLTENFRTTVIPNGVEVADWIPSPRKRVIGFLGRNHPDKGADRLDSIVPALLARLPDWRFMGAGHGMQAHSESLRSALVAKGIDPDLAVLVGEVDSSEFLAQCDVLLVPSRTESFPNVVIEAIVSGAVPVCANVGGIGDVLGGLLDLAGDAKEMEELAVHICSLADSERLLLTKDLYDAVRLKYEISEVAAQHVALWRGGL